jgi:hypothetical protein
MKSKIHQDSLVLARRIRAAGIPIYIGEDDGEAPHDPRSGLLVYKDGRPNETRAFDFYGAAGYIINVVITVNLPHFAIAGFSLELPWNSHVRWLDDPIESGGDSDVYRFDRGYLLEFERNQVLNRFADVRRVWSRGESLKGYLLGIGDQPIPNQFEQGAMIPALLIIYDQLWREYRWPVSLWRDRTEKPVRHDRSGMRRKGGLLDHRDPIGHD